MSSLFVPYTQLKNSGKSAGDATLPSGPITALVVCVTSTHSYIFGEGHIRVWHRALCSVHDTSTRRLQRSFDAEV